MRTTKTIHAMFRRNALLLGLVLFGLVLFGLVGLTGCKDRAREIEEQVAAEGAANKKRMEQLISDAKPRLDALNSIVAAANELPPPSAAPDVATIDPAKVRYVRLDYLAGVLARQDKPKDEPHYPYFGDSVGSYSNWMTAVGDVVKNQPSGYEKHDDAFAQLMALEYVAVVKPTELALPVMKDGFFQGGAMVGDAHLFELASARPLGGVRFTAKSSEEIDFTIYEQGSADKAQSAESAVFGDFHEQVSQAISSQLGLIAKP
jgi:hypothetical protein